MTRPPNNPERPDAVPPASGEGDASPPAALEGTLERVTFHNEENGYTVARLTPAGRGHVVTIVGPLPGVHVGASLRLTGRWKTHAQYGKQFEIEGYEERLPATVEGLRRYLGSGLIKGVGPVTADRIVDHFGLDTLDIIDTAPERLIEVPGVGRVRTDKITRAWHAQRQIKAIMLFLQSHGVSTSLAVRIYKTYGDEAAAVVRQDPYRLAREVFGIGFVTADRIARDMGLPADSPRRVEAGLLYALGQAADDGQCFVPRHALVPAAASLLDVPPEAVDGGVDGLVASEAVWAEPLSAVAVDAAPEGVAAEAIYLPPFHRAEVGVAGRLRRQIATPETRLGAFRTLDWPTALAWLDRRAPHPLAGKQRDAVRMALTEKVSVLTGGPGTGKTTTVRAVLQLLTARGGSVRLAAPTGRAAKRLAETTGLEAKTLHRLLEFSPSAEGLFKRNADHPIDADLIVVDEVSMVDILLMNHLVKAVDPRSHLLLIGDVDQLPSVGAGNVLRDVIASGAVATVALDEIFRQDERSHIVVNAHRINRGRMPIVDNRASTDFFLSEVEDAERAAERVVDFVARRIPAGFGMDPLDDVQVLSPMHRGAAGVAALNERLQGELNPPSPERPEVRFGGRAIRLGDKVMQVRNNYDKDVYNGDLGRVTDIDPVERTVTVRFDGRGVAYEFGELDELIHAFACSTHKSQGAEYPAVVMALLPAHHMMLQRNLLYTGITRAKRLCVIVGARRAISAAVRNDRVARRHTGLAARLSGAPAGGAERR